MPLRKQRAVLAAEVEAAEGTPETIVAADGILSLSAEFKENIEMVPNDPFRESLSQLASVPGRYTGSISAQIQGRGSGTVDVPPEVGDLLRGCGFLETINAASDVTYTPASTALETATVALFQDGIRHQIAGARGNVSFGAAVGEFLVWNFEMLGVENLTTDVAILAPTYQTTVPKPVLNATFTFQTVALIASSFSMDMGIVLAPRQDFTQLSGHKSVFYGNRIPVGNIVVEKDLVANFDFYGIMKAGTEGAFNLVWGTAGGNRWTVNAPKAQIIDITEQEDNGKAMLSVDFKLNLDTAGDDELTLKHD